MNVEWVGRTNSSVTEAAEALGVQTDDVMAMAQHEDGRWTVLWSSDEATTGLDAPVRAAALKRDADGILRVVSLPHVVGTVRDFLPDHP